MMAATQRALGTPELLEHILLHLSLRELLTVKSVNGHFAAVIEGSAMIGKVLYLQPITGTVLAWSPQVNVAGSSTPTDEKGEWRTMGENVTDTLVPILNPFLVATKQAYSGRSGHLMQSPKKVGLEISKSFDVNDDPFASQEDREFASHRLNITYKYSNVYATQATLGSIAGMLVTQPPCSTIHLLHRSVDPARKQSNGYYDRFGLRKRIWQYQNPFGVKVGMLLNEMMGGAPSIEDQDKQRAKIEKRTKQIRAGYQGGTEELLDGVVGREDALLSFAALTDWCANEIAKPENVKQPPGNTKVGPDPMIAFCAATKGLLMALLDRDTRPGGTTGRTGNMKPAIELESVSVDVKGVDTHSYTADYGIVGATRWLVLNGTVDTITGWQMLRMFDMSEEELRKQRLIL
ncbi:hypothetical protein LTR56_008812 [Elasticomyces elasticus]|nr:hypothetical protein LTR22_021713 [Elasticomyces elasticus]KAK3645934.1 hypothetical protein LTR56_008812 [Elasticomyces elasticus]KAK4928115.1 hypothetical protein LTR49_005053 [Elasticomyces elasticus]KAK5765868.1 hypothetical protein LTS12_003875 [Elasticomyces elasticus]